MEYLNHISDSLSQIDESNLTYINILEHPEYVRGTISQTGAIVDFSKFSVAARNSMKRFEAAAQKDMENYYNSSSGCRVLFRTNSPRMVLKASLKKKWSLRKMNLWNSSGFDFYEDINGEFVHKTIVGPADGYSVFAEEVRLRRNPICIYLPLYNVIEELYIGIEKGNSLDIYRGKDYMKPIVFYGHSVTQGAAASRPGNCFPNIVQRRMKREMINISCSYSCRGQIEVAEQIGRLNCQAIIVDYTRNAYCTDYLKKTHEKFYRRLRQFHPHIRIVLMTSCNFNKWQDYFEFDEVVKETYEEAMKRKENTKLLDVMSLFEEEEYGMVAVDGSHVNDVGMYRIADALVQLLKEK